MGADAGRDGLTISASGPLTVASGQSAMLTLLPTGVVATAAARFLVGVEDTNVPPTLDINATHCTINTGESPQRQSVDGISL